MFEWFSQQATLTFLHPYFAMSKLKYSMQDRQKPFSEFQQTTAVETFDHFRYKSFLTSCVYSTWFMFIEFVFKLVSGSLFFFSCSRHQKPLEEALWIQVTGSAFKQKTNKHGDHPSVPYNKLLTNLASSSRTGEYWPSVVLYGPRCARSVLPRPRANIPRYGPRARLVRGYYSTPLRWIIVKYFFNISEGIAFLLQGVTENDFRFERYKFKIWEIRYD